MHPQPEDSEDVILHHFNPTNGKISLVKMESEVGTGAWVTYSKVLTSANAGDLAAMVPQSKLDITQNSHSKILKYG